MKNITISLFTILCLMMNYSCVKEQDITTPTISTTEPEEGGTDDLTGFVRDTLGQVIPNVNVKLYLGDLELETETDINGEYNFLIPNNQQEGYVVADKIDYSKGIQYFEKDDENTLIDFYLAKEEAQGLDLNIDLDNLLTVRGRIVDQFSNPVENTKIFIRSYYPAPSVESEINGVSITNENGNFELIYEDKNYSTTVLFAINSIPCSELVGLNWQNPEPIKELGDITMNIYEISTLETLLISNSTFCTVPAQIQAYKLFPSTPPIGQNIPNIYGQPMGNMSLDFCEEGNEVFYIGALNEDKTDFNGRFVPLEQIEENYTFDICTPTSNNFLEVMINGETILHTENIDYESTGNVISLMENQNFTAFNITVNMIKHDQYGVNVIKKGVMDFFTRFENGSQKYNLHENSPNYVNIVQDDLNIMSGLVQAKVVDLNVGIKDMIIRFRVEK